MDSLSLASGFDPDSLIVETLNDFRVSGRVYTDQEIFRLEMKHIFGRCWIYLGHESEIPNPGDYKTAYIGLRPVIVTRDENGAVHAMLNRCRHRGSVICRAHTGNEKRFQCQYHGWVYGLNGDLLGIAKHKGGYPDDFDKASYGLMAVPRVTVYRGLVFANMRSEAHV